MPLVYAVDEGTEKEEDEQESKSKKFGPSNVPTHNVEVVGANPAYLTLKARSVKKTTGKHPRQSTFVETTC